MPEEVTAEATAAPAATEPAATPAAPVETPAVTPDATTTPTTPETPAATPAATPADAPTPEVTATEGKEETLETIVAAENARIEAERIAASAAPAATEGIAPPALAPTVPADEAPPVISPESLRPQWEAKKAQLKTAWEQYDAPGEKVLVEVIDSLIAHIDSRLAPVTEFQQGVERAAIEREAATYVAAATDAAQELGTEFGLTLTANDLLGLAKNGGMAALAALEGRTVDSYRGRIDKTILRSVFELKNRALMARLSTAVRKPGTPAPARPLTTGGGASETQAPRTDLDQAIEDMRLARAANGR
jgi:hypothetical protein